MDVPLERWPTGAIPYRVTICCASCSHSWLGKLTRLERGFDV